VLPMVCKVDQALEIYYGAISRIMYRAAHKS
jgi:hypothetical protein